MFNLYFILIEIICILITEKVCAVGLEPVAECLPVVRLKSKNNLVLRHRI